MSAPVLGSNSTSDIEESFLLRSSEVENIPEIIEETSDIDRSSQRHSFSRSCSTGATPPPPPPPLLLLEQDSKNSDMSLPPPPPPPPVGDGIPLSMQTRTLLSVGDAGTLASIAGTSSNASTMQSDDGEEDTKKKKRLPAERSYYIAKELLMTERTYKKDLEVITWFRSNLTQRGLPLDYAVQLLFSYLDPIYEFHCAFLKQVEQRISMWEGKSSAQVNGDCQRIGDVILSNIEGLQLYQNYLDRQEEILTELEQTLKKNKELELTYKEFEAEKVCYLPLNTFLLKPGQRLLHYKLILDRLTKYYGKSHPDYGDCQEALTHVLDITHPFREKMRKVENLQKLIELQRDLVGIDSLVHPEREFIREGCLQKFSRKGYQQRMFFLFSDMLVYTSRTATSLLQFKVHGQLPLRGMMVEVSDMSKVAVANSFTIYGGNKCVLVAASTEEEKDKWIEDLNDGISLARRQNDDKIKYGSIKSTASSSENIAGDAMNDSAAAPPSPEKQIQHRANTTMHVCWHRNTSVSMRDHERAIKNQLSGYLLRKFKTSNGWQKLWVVFTNFCLFFYKTYQDDFPLASLPLLGYAVNVPGEDDKITKDHVFKLQFKNHVYFFRAESEYTFERWIEVINSATSSARRIRLFSRLESEPSGRS